MLQNGLGTGEDTVSDYMGAFKISRMPALYLSILMGKDGAVTPNQFESIVYGGARRSEKMVHVMICKLRAALRPHGIQIENLWGRGYRMGAASKEQLKLKVREWQLSGTR